MSRTKIVGYLILAIAILKTTQDALDGNGFNWATHFDEVYAALTGAGLVFLRSAIDKIQPITK